MNYIYASEYNFKLYQIALSKGYEVTYLNSDHIYSPQTSDICLIDESCPQIHQLDSDEKHYVLTSDTSKLKNDKFIYKYQAATTVLSKVFKRNKSIKIFFGSRDQLNVFVQTQEDYIVVNFNYTPESNTTLMDLIALLESDEHHISYFAPFGTLMDIIKPPLKTIERLVLLIKSKTNAIFFMESLKGPVDYLLLTHANEIIFPGNYSETLMASYNYALNQIFPSLKITLDKASSSSKEGRGLWRSFHMKR